MSRHRLTSLRRHSLSGGDKGSVWDLYATNGFLRPVTNDNASTKWVEDKDGTLVQSPAGVPVMPGCRFADGAWYSTDTDGTPLYITKQLIRTPQGSVQEFDETYPGVLVEPAATNKCACRKVNPTDTTNFIKAGDAASVLAVVDDATALATAKRSNICTSGYVYELDNSAGSAKAYAIIVGGVGNTNAHSFRALCRAVAGTGYLYMYTIAGMPEISSAAYADVQKLNHTPTNAVATIGIAANEGAVVRFIMPELIEAPFLGTPVMPKPTEDGLSAVTRLADQVSFATPAWLLQRPNDFAVIQRCIPAAVQDAKHLLSSYTDASNELSLILSTSAVTFRKRAGGTSTDTAVTYTHVAATLFEVIAYSTTVLGTGIALRSCNGTIWSDWSAWTTNDAAGAKANAVFASTVLIGTQTTSAGHCAATFPMTRLLRIPTNLNASALQAWLVAKAGA